MDRVVDYYIAPQSPFVYLGHARFAALLDSRGVAPRVKPVDGALVFAASGGLQLSQRPAQRQSYRLLELQRFAKHLALPLNPTPRFFPVSGEPAALRIIAVARTVGERAAMDLSLAFQRAVWVEERDITDPATVAAIVRSGGLDADAVEAGAADEASAAAYAANTQEAIAAEVFGVPTYIPRFGSAIGQRFWGQDRIDLLADALDG